MKTLVISGYYGFDNAGDEAVLQAILYSLKQQAPFVRPVVLSANPEKTADQYGVEAVHRFRFKEIWNALKKADGLISGGGSLLQDATGTKTIPYYIGIIKLAQLLGKPTFIYSQGVGPVNRKAFYPLIRSGFSKAKYIAVRDKESSNLLETMKIPANKIETVVDPVLTLPPSSKEKIRKLLQKENILEPSIMVSVRFWKDNLKYLDTIASVLDQLAKDGEKIVFVPMHEPSDREASQYVMDKMEESAQILSSYEPRDLIGIMAESKLLIGMRLHSLIFATAMGIPSVGVSYDPKIDQFLAQLQQTPVGTTEDLEATIILDQIKYILGNMDQHKEEVVKRATLLKEQAQIPAKKIAEFFQEK